MDAHRRPMAAGDRHQADAGKLGELRREPALDQVLDVGQLHRVRGDAEGQDRRVGRIDLGIDRRRRQVGRQQVAGRVDRRLHFLLGDVEADVEAEAQGDDGRPGRTRRHHLAEARHLAELALERRGHGRGHHLRARAGIEGLHLDGRIVDLRQRRQRQKAIGRDADEQDRDHQEAGRDRPVDEDAGRVHQRGSGGASAHCADAAWRARRRAAKARFRQAPAAIALERALSGLTAPALTRSPTLALTSARRSAAAANPETGGLVDRLRLRRQSRRAGVGRAASLSFHRAARGALRAEPPASVSCVCRCRWLPQPPPAPP